MNQPASEGHRMSRRGFMVQAGSAGLVLGVAPESSYAQSGGKGAMKITGVQTYKFSVPTGQEIRDPNTGELISSTAKPWLFLKITTDAGIVGWGEGSGEWLVPSVEATLHEWKPLLIGQDPLGVVRLTEDIQNRLPWKGGATFGTAIAAINIALYDIAGKAWGVPIHTILGGRRRHKVRVYTGGALFDSPQAAVEQAQRVAEAGFAGVKGNPLETRTWPMDEAAVAHSVACVEAMRSAMGPHFDILLDTHGSPTPELSIDYARRVAPYKPLFLEEPVKVGSIEALLAVSRNSPVPIATGEKLFTLNDFKPIIDQRACAVLQPDTLHAFGITSLLEIAKAAEQNQMLMAPHVGGGPLYYGATLAADSVMNNFLIQETGYWDQFDRFVEHEWQIKDGYVNVTDLPGLGVEVKEQDIAKMPYQPLPFRQYRHQDGSWKGW